MPCILSCIDPREEAHVHLLPNVEKLLLIVSSTIAHDDAVFRAVQEGRQ